MYNGRLQNSVYQYTLSTPWDLSTASYDSVSFSVTSQDTTPVGIAFKSDGSKMYVVGVTNGSVYQYTLSTPSDTYFDLMAQKGADGTGTGDMLASVYDKTNVAGDAFDMDNMVEGTNNKLVSPLKRLLGTTN